MVELNIVEQIYKLAHTPIVQQAWKNRQAPSLHGWVYGLDDGLIQELVMLNHEYTNDSIYRYLDL